MILTFLAIVARDVHVRQRAKRRKVVDVRVDIQASLVRSHVPVVWSVVHRREASIDALHRMLNSIERE